MKRLLRFLTALICALTVAGCASIPESSLQEPYRPAGMEESAEGYAVLKVGQFPYIRSIEGVKDKSLSSMTLQREAYIVVPAGDRRLEVGLYQTGYEKQKKTLWVDFEPDHVYLLQTVVAQEEWGVSYNLEVYDLTAGRPVSRTSADE